MKYLLVFLFTINFLFGMEDFSYKEKSMFDAERKLKIKVINKFISSKNIYLSYEKYPKQIYTNQRFSIGVKALITKNNFDLIKTSFINKDSIVPLNPDNKWLQINDKTYTNQFYFKAYEKNFIMPDIKVSLFKDGRLLEERMIKSNSIIFSQVAKGVERFSHIIAKNLKIIAAKTKQYNNKESLSILDIEAIDSNLEDFNIKNVEDQGFSLFEDNYPKQHIIYYLVLPIYQKTISFNYYNTQSKKLDEVKIYLKLDNELISTQTDLNPNTSKFALYKKMAILALFISFLVLFIWKRKLIFFIFCIFFGIILTLYILPNKTINLKANTNIYILPTNNSTIFQKIKYKTKVEHINTKADFVKIMFNVKNKKIIGWVKKNDISKN